MLVSCCHIRFHRLLHLSRLLIQFSRSLVYIYLHRHPWDDHRPGPRSARVCISYLRAQLLLSSHRHWNTDHLTGCPSLRYSRPHASIAPGSGTFVIVSGFRFIQELLAVRDLLSRALRTMILWLPILLQTCPWWPFRHLRHLRVRSIDWLHHPAYRLQ